MQVAIRRHSMRVPIRSSVASELGRTRQLHSQVCSEMQPMLVRAEIGKR
jgi:hypothetical protein